LLRLEGLLLRNKSRSWLSESRSSRLLWDLGLSKELSMRGISGVDEGVYTSTVRTVGDGGGTWEDLGSLGCPLRLGYPGCLRGPWCLGGLKLSSIGVGLEIQVCWVGRVDKWVELRGLLGLSCWSNLLSLNWSLLKLLLSSRNLTNRSLANRSLANRSWTSSRSFTHRSRSCLLWFLELSSCRVWIKCCRV